MTTPDPRRGLPSASSMYRVANCPGSVLLASTLKRDGKYYALPNPDADAGTRIHSYLALQYEGDSMAEKVLNSRHERTVADKCIELREQIVSDWLRATSGNDEQPMLQFILEKRFWFRQGLWPRFSGQPDFIVIDRTNQRALVCNYKTGRKESAPASDNMQLRCEVVLLKAAEPNLVEITGTIIEPLVSWESERVQYDAAALLIAESQLLAIVTRAEFEPQTRVPGDWCIYCPARCHCLEARQYVETIPNLPLSKLSAELPKGEPGTLLWRKIQVAQKLLEDMEAAYTTLLENDPDYLPGLILPKEGKARRVVPHAGTLKHALAEYLSAEEVDACATYFPAKVQELLGVKLGIDGKELERKFRELTKEAVVTTHDRPFVRERTKKEREMAALQPPAEPKEELVL